MSNRILLKIEYNGSNYSGWQRQLNAPSIQAIIEDSLSAVTHEHITIHGSGRTDKGVHAWAQYANFDTDCVIPPHNYAYILNNLLPPDIRIIYSKTVPLDFHARFSALSKTYRYLFWVGMEGSAVRHDTHHNIPHLPNLELMQKAAQELIGTHDFAALSSKGSNPSSTIRTVTNIDVSLSPIFPHQEIILSVSGNSFLYNMVRVIAAQLLRAGYAQIRLGRLSEILLLKDRHNAKDSAPACGLYLSKVVYAEEFDID